MNVFRNNNFIRKLHKHRKPCHIREKYTLKEVVDHFANLESDDGDDSGVLKTYFFITSYTEFVGC